MTCKQCNKQTDKPMIRKIVDLGSSSIGQTNIVMCSDCLVQAEIELRDFIKQSKYFTELKPF